jgi:methionyl aminopeptidase
MEPQKNLNLSYLIKSGEILASCLEMSKQMLSSKYTPVDIDTEVERFIISNGGMPSFKGLHGYPFSTCISFNEQVVHTTPAHREVLEDDIITVDIGVSYCGHCTDAARTYMFNGNPGNRILIDTAYKALDAGIERCVENNHVGDVSYSIQKEIELAGFKTVLEIGGHGIGLEAHEDPFVPNYGVCGRGPKLIYGMCLAIEPIVIEKNNRIVLDKKDGWSLYSPSRCLSAHTEDTVVVLDKKPLILTRKTLSGSYV